MIIKILMLIAWAAGTGWVIMWIIAPLDVARWVKLTILAVYLILTFWFSADLLENRGENDRESISYSRWRASCSTVHGRGLRDRCNQKEALPELLHRI